MTLPNYFYGGPPKAGSSWIYSLLEDHPEVFVPEGKYVQFFTDFHERGIDWYEKLYADAGPAQTALCDLTTDYMFVPEAAERLAKHVPNAKIFFSLRNPIERDWSAYQHLLRIGQIKGAIEDEIETSHRLLSGCSAYSDAIERSWRLFGKENTHVLWFEDIRSHPQLAADSLHDFLGVARRTLTPDAGGAKNVARGARNPAINGLLKRAAITARAAGLGKVLGKLKSSSLVDRMLFREGGVPKLKDQPEVNSFLSNRHADEISRLEELLSKDLSAWRM